MSNARDWHAVALDKLDRQIAATADRWGECVHGPEVAISLRGMRSGLEVTARGERSASSVLARLDDDGPVKVMNLYVHPNPSARFEVIVMRGEQLIRWQGNVTVPDLQAAVDLVTETAGIAPQLALTEGPT